MPVFRHPKFELVGRKVSGEVPDSEYESVVTALTTYVQEAMRELGLREVWIPEKNAAARCCVFASEKLDKAKKILVILQNRVGGVPGIWSRSLCVKQGLDIGSMLPAIERALGDGYAVVVPNPNTNTVNRVPILHSLSPEDHVLHIWDTIVPAEVPTYLLTLGNGASLAVDVVEREQVREMRTVAVAAVEPSQVAGSDIDEATRARLARIVLAFEGNAKHEYPARLSRAEARLGCRCFAVRSDNLGRTMASSLDSIFAYFKSEATAAADYAAGEAQRAALVDFQVDDGGPRTTFYDDDEDEEDEGGRVGIRPSCAPGLVRVFSRLLFRQRTTEKKKEEEENNRKEGSTRADYEFLVLVGKGAFGKVFMARHIHTQTICAVKVLKKHEVVQHKQVEHTLSERQVLSDTIHPFVVRLRAAFQSTMALYLVTDFYNGGTLYYHLRRAPKGYFDEPRAKFYAAEILLGLDHLHHNGVVYRDLKLENILLDFKGHIAITDFGLSKRALADVYHNVMDSFCGTPDYIAPEMLQGLSYNATVDWWSYGILTFEMLGRRSPFYDKNRDAMYAKIIKTTVISFPTHFSAPAKALLDALLRKDPHRRLGAPPGGAADIKKHHFFRSINFTNLLEKNLNPPWMPELKSETDTAYVPSSYKTVDPATLLPSETTEPTIFQRRRRAANDDKTWNNFNFKPQTLTALDE